MKIPEHKVFVGTERFVIQRQLGAGAFGTVYQAYDNERNAVVALKVLRQTDPSALYRFKKEFRALTNVIHPNLVALYELMSDGQNWFFTMELVSGVSFLEYVQGGSDLNNGEGPDVSSVVSTVLNTDWRRDYEGGLPAMDSKGRTKITTMREPLRTTPANINRLREALLSLAEGVCALHDEGQIHRDLKPSNVMVTTEGRVVLLDFGMVTELAPQDFRRSLTFAGTPAYMSPEQAAEQPLTEASDWYCVGVMLYEALTGRLPFSGQFLEVLTNKQVLEPPAPAESIIDVPEDLNNLCRDLLRLDPQSRPKGRDVVLRLRDASKTLAVKTTATVQQRASVLVGREIHLTELREAFAAMKDGLPVTVYLHGSSGMGKSILAHYFLEEVQQNERDPLLLMGRCYEQESVPYKALDSLIDNLSRYLMSLAPATAAALLPRDVLALARLFPVLRQVNAVASARRRVLEIPDSQELRRRASAALRELLIRLADRQPTVIFLDDLQWGDIDSAALLGELLRPPEPPPLLLIAAYRSEEAEASPLIQALLSMKATYSEPVEMREIEVGELSPAEARELALLLQDNDGATASVRADAIAQESGGNPFFINELVRYLQTSETNQSEESGRQPDRNIELGETTLEAVINARVSQLPGPARQLLEVVAVAGRPIEIGLATQATGISLEVLSILPLLRANHLIRTRGTDMRGEIVAYHDRIRETVVAYLSPEALQAYHRSLALTFESSGLADPEILALHFQRAGEDERAAEYALMAADKASAALAFERAAGLYRLALELQLTREEPERRNLRIKLGDALANAGRSAAAADVYIEAAVGAPAWLSLELKRRAAEQLLRSGHVDKGLTVVKSVLESVGMKLPETPRRALASIITRRTITRLRGLDFEERDVSQITTHDLTRIDICWSMAIGLARIDNIRAAYFQALHLKLALQAGEAFRVVRALAAEAGFAATAGGSGKRRTDRFLQAVDALSQRVNHPHALAHATFARAIAAFYHGRFKIALDLSEKAEAIFRERCTGVTWEINTAHSQSHSSLFYLGEIDELSRRVPLRLREAHERGDLYATADAGMSRSNVVWLAADDVDGSRRAIQEAMRGWSVQGFHAQHYWELFAEGQTSMYAGNGAAAWKRIVERWPALADSLTLRVQLNRIEALHLRGRSALAAVDSGADAKLLVPAAERDAQRLDHEKMGWAQPLSYLLFAGVFAIRGDKETSVRMLCKAESGFDNADMALYAAAARQRRGELLGGDEGQALVEAANSWMTAQNIRNPTRMTAMLAPGFGGI